MIDYLELTMKGELDAVLARLTDDVSLDLQSLGSGKGKREARDLLRRQKEHLDGKIRAIKVIRSFAGDGSAVVEYDVSLESGVDLPIALIATTAGDRFSSLRTYHSVYPLTEGHELRPALPGGPIELVEPASVVAYFQGVARGSTEEVMSTLSFEDDVYFREPAGWRWTHKGRDGLKAHFDHFFGDGGIPLKFHHAVFDRARGAFAGEYTCDVWGSTVMKPQAGMSIYDVSPANGKIVGIRVYDNVDLDYR